MPNKKLSKCIDDLKKLKGLPPYDDWSNVCANDGYFAKSIQNRYDAKTIEEAERIIKERRTTHSGTSS